MITLNNKRLLEAKKICKIYLIYSILLDTRQNEELRIKGYAREIINRVQKLKKKSRLNAED